MDAIDIAQQALQQAFVIAAPALIAVFATAVIVGIIQAATQINEFTLSFVPKLLVLVLVLTLLGAWMIEHVADVARELWGSIASVR